MRSKTYSDLRGIDVSKGILSAPQIAFIESQNYLPGQSGGALQKRPGSEVWTHTGDIFGAYAYKKESTAFRIPATHIPIQHLERAHSWGLDFLRDRRHRVLCADLKPPRHLRRPAGEAHGV